MPESFGEYIKRIREALGHSQRWVGQTAARFPKKAERISGSYLSQLERGEECNPSAEKLRGLARIYHLDYVDLMKRAGKLPGIVAEPAPARTTPSWNDLFTYMEELGFTTEEIASVKAAEQFAKQMEQVRPKVKKRKQGPK